MKDFSDIDYVTGAFPDALAVDSSGPTVRDGVPLVADWVNELFGAFQAMLDYTNITASGSSESASATPASFSSSQIITAIRRMAGAPGEVTYFAGRDPDIFASGVRLLHLAGQGILVADFPDLVAAVYCGDSANPTASSFYKTNNPLALPIVRSTSGTYMMLPDCRGRFLRSLNDTAASPVDIDRNLNSLNDEPGSVQLSQSGSHDHNVGWYDGSTTNVTCLNNEEYYMYSLDPGYPTVPDAGETGAVPDPVRILTRIATELVNDTTEGFGRTSDGGFDYAVPTDIETRPRNVAFHAMIRY